MKKQKLNLYVWTDFCPDYTSGLAFAIAESEAQARSLITIDTGDAPYEWGRLEVYDLTSPVAYAVTGGA